MCGIAGIVGSSRARIGSMLDRLAHRGPDARGTWELPALDATLGHTRLSILDLDARSNQPFVSPCARYVLTFNGEIYNYVELRAKLEAEGTTFRTTSDTEVLLHWLVRRGAAGVADLEGMFAFALADRDAHTILLARDPIGEKPLYYALPRGGVRFAFASEIGALLVLPDVDASIDEEGLADYLRFLYTAAPHTLYAGVRELAPGHVLEIDTRAPRDQPRRYYDLESRVRDPFDGSYADAIAAFRATFFDALRMRLRSDVPLGVYLSGGLDSNSILGAARAIDPYAELNTFTARYDGSQLSRALDESALAARAAQAQRVANFQIPFEEDEDFLGSVARIVELFGQPFGNATAVVADKIAARASRGSRVCLVGDGGDEILAGYPRHKVLATHRRMQAIPLGVRNLLRAATHVLPERGSTATRLRRIKQFAKGLAQPLPQCFVDWSSYVDDAGIALALGRTRHTQFHDEMLALFTRNEHDPVRAAALVDLRSFVPFNLMQAADRTGMAHPLELRCPFLAPKLVELALSFDARYKLQRGRSKPLLADALAREIPPFVARQPKRAFNPPMQSYVRSHLVTLERYVLGTGALIGELVSPRFVRAEIEAFQTGRRDNSTLLWGLASLECWLRARGRPRRHALADLAAA
jgi:asparagine synthase (glutamine-hydrolysing)